MRRLFFCGMIIFLSLTVTISPVHAYSYAEVEDPMVTIFKTALTAAKGSNWGEVSKQAKEGVALQKGHNFEATNVESGLKESIGKKDVSGTAMHFANLVYLSIKEKFLVNKKENFKNYKNAKGRLALARKSYIDVLDGNVKKKNPSTSETIMKQFSATLNAIGNPGLFGIGQKAPDSAAYDKAVKQIEELIQNSFPDFSK